MSNPLTEESFFQELILDICDRKTTADLDNWTAENPLWGQCEVVSLIAQDFFGGELLRVSLKGTPFEGMGSHYFNRFPDGSEHDFTSRQFEGNYPEGLKDEERTRESLLSNESTKERYEILDLRIGEMIGKP